MATMNFFADTGDGYVDNNDSVYSTCRNAATGTGSSSTVTNIDESLVCRAILFGGNYYISRGFFPFDTSALGSGSTVTATDFNLYIEVTATFDPDTDSFCVVQTSQASTSSLTTADFDAVNFTNGGAKTIASFSVANQYWTWTLNGTGLGWINTTGFTKLGLQSLLDINNTTPTGLNQLTGQTYFSDNTGTSKDPYLAVTYTAGSSFTPTPMMHMMQIAGGNM